MPNPRRFTVWINEGAFFHEPWLSDRITKKDYRYDRIPRAIMALLIQECTERGRCGPDITSIVFDFALKEARRRVK